MRALAMCKDRTDCNPTSPSGEIEVTPAMVAAGVQEFYDHDLRFDDANVVIADVFRVMAAASASPPQISG